MHHTRVYMDNIHAHYPSVEALYTNKSQKCEHCGTNIHLFLNHMSMKLYIATPMYGGQCLVPYAKSLIESVRQLKAINIETRLDFVSKRVSHTEGSEPDGTQVLPIGVHAHVVCGC